MLLFFLQELAKSSKISMMKLSREERDRKRSTLYVLTRNAHSNLIWSLKTLRCQKRSFKSLKSLTKATRPLRIWVLCRTTPLQLYLRDSLTWLAMIEETYT